jgi:hypothetical protein
MIPERFLIQRFTGMLHQAEVSVQTASDAVGHSQHAIGHNVKKLARGW